MNPFKTIMKELCLSPFPVHRANDPSSLLLMEQEGFVDEAVVTALMAASPLGRRVADPDDLVLAADDLDFAGWRLSKAVIARTAEVPPQVIDAIVRRPSLPATGEPRRDSRHSSSHRWWLTGLAGVMIPAVLLSLPGHLGLHLETLLSPRATTPSLPVPLNRQPPPQLSPKLNEHSRLGR